MFTTLWTWFVKLFTANKIGILLSLLAKNAANKIATEILDPDNQKKAYEFVKELNANDALTTKEKTAIFNKKLTDWAKAKGKVLNGSIINCLRELAVNAIKAELGK